MYNILILYMVNFFQKYTLKYHILIYMLATSHKWQGIDARQQQKVV
nr:MAG TPA: hypothetical protein [Caudoviricetes sp.]